MFSIENDFYYCFAVDVDEICCIEGIILIEGAIVFTTDKGDDGVRLSITAERNY